MEMRSRVRLSSSWDAHGDLAAVLYIMSRSGCCDRSLANYVYSSIYSGVHEVYIIGCIPWLMCLLVDVLYLSAQAVC